MAPFLWAGTTMAQSFTGTTTGGPTWNRPVNVGTGASGSCTLSAGATNVPHRVLTFTVPATGAYTVTTTWSAFDGFLLLYAGTFNAADPCLNLIALNDDFGGGTTQSQIALEQLSAGVTYRLVLTGFGNSSFGAYTGTFAGPAPVSITGITATAAYSGTTAGGPTWTRPSTVGTGTSGSCTLSGTGTNVPYWVEAMVVPATGAYTITATWAAFDGYLLLYQNAFDAADPCLNLIALNDDFGGGTTQSQITDQSLTAGTIYYVVHTGFSTTSSGPYIGTAAGPGFAAIGLRTTYTGTTTGGPTWNRPATVGTGASGSCTLSASGSNVPYRVVQVTVPTTGIYTVTTEWDAFDGYLFLYQNAFNAADPCLNLMSLNDDAGSVARSQIRSVTLTAGTTYFLIHTGFGNAQVGAYAGAFVGPAAVAVVTVSGEEGPVAGRALLGTPRPNPTVARAEMTLTVESAQRLTVEAFDLLGRRVAVLLNADVGAGAHTVRFDGSGLGAGTYVVRATGEDFVDTQRVTVTR